MEKIKNSIKNNKILAVVLILLVVYVAFYALSSDAAKNSSLGQLSAVLTPAHPDGVGTETLILGWGGGGPLDVSNWRFSNADGTTYIFRVNEIPAIGSIRLCAEKAQDPQCDLEWGGGEMWDDGGSVFSLYNNLGGKVLEFNYGTVEIGEKVSGSVEYTDGSKGNGARFALCHEKNDGSFSQVIAQNNNFGKALSRSKGHHTHVGDIIPSFYYDLGAGEAFYPGLNWTDPTTGTHANGCN